MSQHEAWFVARTMQALEVLAFAPLSAPQVATSLGVHPRTARRMLNRLVDEGYLTRTGPQDRLYEPTLRIVALAGQIVARNPLAATAQPFVTRLHADADATAHLLVPSYRSVLCLVHRGQGDRNGPRIRELVPAHCTAGGKVLLSWRDPWRESVLAKPLERHTPHTRTDVRALLDEISEVRARGYAVDRGEYQEDVRGVAAPVFSPAGEVVAALALTGPDDLTSEARRVVAVAAELSAALEADGG